jgi:PAS domain S-box-containing protein
MDPKLAELRRLHLAAIVEWSDDAIFSKDLDGRILSWNRGAEKMYGYTAAEAVGSHVRLIVPPAFHPELERIMERIRRGEPVDHQETRRRHKDGRLLHVSVTVSPMRNERGDVIAASTIARDISDLVEAAQKERRHTEALLQANAQLRRLNGELERFAYVAAHDLREPLRTIAIYTELLQARYGGQLGADADEIIGFVVSGATRLHELVRDLLAVSRVGERRHVTAVDPEGVLDDVVSDLRAAIEERGAHVTRDALLPVETDRTELQQLFQNLLANALKFCEGRPRVHVSSEPAGDRVRFCVRDNGIGIEPDQRERIFVLFQRLRPAYGGTGVGLAICKKIVEGSGGRIWIEDAPGGGSRFLFTLPAASPR